jgi:hypothetical protein
MSCSGESHPESFPLRWSVAVGALRTELVFDGSRHATLDERSLSVGLSYQVDPKTTLSLGAGSGLGGTVEAAGQTFALTAGPLVSASLSRQLLDGQGALPFVSVTATVAESSVVARPRGEADGAAFTSIDFRASGVVGKTFFNWLSPYAGLAVFGGPVFWTDGAKASMGTDTHHYQVLLGAVASLPQRFDLFVEGSPVGERSLSAGLGRRF